MGSRVDRAVFLGFAQFFGDESGDCLARAQHAAENGAHSISAHNVVGAHAASVETGEVFSGIFDGRNFPLLRLHRSFAKDFAGGRVQLNARFTRGEIQHFARMTGAVDHAF